MVGEGGADILLLGKPGFGVSNNKSFVVDGQFLGGQMVQSVVKSLYVPEKYFFTFVFG